MGKCFKWPPEACRVLIVWWRLEGLSSGRPYGARRLHLYTQVHTGLTHKKKKRKENIEQCHVAKPEVYIFKHLETKVVVVLEELFFDRLRGTLSTQFKGGSNKKSREGFALHVHNLVNVQVFPLRRRRPIRSNMEIWWWCNRVAGAKVSCFFVFHKDI